MLSSIIGNGHMHSKTWSINTKLKPHIRTSDSQTLQAHELRSLAHSISLEVHKAFYCLSYDARQKFDYIRRTIELTLLIMAFQGTQDHVVAQMNMELTVALARIDALTTQARQAAETKMGTI
ncbi:hypothetical protein L6452_09250 [Arctium lappa]|uniref:Uncharacterized protein n=1 Tax=Arctium lappa TaxID=4217 RepID=A0ACB9DJJ3_ARCLA|nr:hypothetical protein L6452_09250 [Arctium lappa]